MKANENTSFLYRHRSVARDGESNERIAIARRRLL